MRFILKKVVSFFLLMCFVSVFSMSVKPADYKRETIYQIITDRFYNGSTTNDNPAQSSGLFDSTQTNWRLYWGGDLQVFRRK